MRRLTGLAVAFASAIWLAASPADVTACTGCPTTFAEVVQGADRIVLTRYVGHSGGQYEYRVVDVLKGRSPGRLLFTYDPVGPPAPPIASRWLISTDVPPDGVLRANVVFGVSPDGSVTPTDEGEGAVEAPGTLAAWYAGIARLPDTATGSSAADPVRTPAPTAVLMGAAVLGAIGMLTRLGRSPSPGDGRPASKPRSPAD